MAQFSVHRNADYGSRDNAPYLLDLQSDLLAPLATRVVVPLRPAAHVGKPAQGLNPVFEVDGEPMVMSTPELAGVARRVLGEEVASLADRRPEIVAALDLLFTGV